MTESTSPVPAPRTMPAPVIDPDDLLVLLPELDPADAARYCTLATVVLEAALWPNPIPDPLPPPLYAAGLSIATRLATAGEAGDAVVSESIGSYTYRLAAPATLGEGFQLTAAELELVAPWAARRRVYDVSVSGPALVYPLDAWQRDLVDATPVVEVDAGRSALEGTL